MIKEDYQQTQEQIRLIAQIVVDMPLMDFIIEIIHAETIGPLANPTLYRQAACNLAKIKSLAEALLPFQTQVLKLKHTTGD